MALSEKWVLENARALLWNPRYTGFNPVAFTSAIEAEVRKDDEALIRQMLEVLSSLDDCGAVIQWEDQWERCVAAINAARARLGAMNRTAAIKQGEKK